MFRSFQLAMGLLMWYGAWAQPVVTRGPYLQSPTWDGMTIMWRTNVATGTSVWYGASPDALSLYSTSASPVTNHVVRISGLAPSTTYYYAVGNGTGTSASGNAAHRFRTFPLPGSEGPLRVWALGDFGKGNANQIAVKQSFTAYPDSARTDAWIWLGDNVYDNGLDSEYQQKLFALTGFRDIFSWLPSYPCPGNHDYSEVWSQSTFFGIPYSNIDLEDHHGPYFDLVSVPQQGEAGGVPSGLELFYSFDLGPAHFISLNSEVYDLLGTFNGIDRMVNWLEQDLAQNQRRFTIAYWHQPPYSKGSHDSEDWTEFVMTAMREHLVPVLEAYDVDLVIGGHSHVYERSHLIHGHYGNADSFDPATMMRDGNGGNYDAGVPYVKDTLNTTDDGTVYVVCGNGGSSESDPPFGHPVMFHEEGGSGVCGSFLIDINGRRLDGTYLRMDGSIGDRFTILKGTELGVPERALGIDVQAYPNPASTQLNVISHGRPGNDAQLRLIDATGRVALVERMRSDRLTLDLHGIARGSYQLVLDGNAGRASLRVMVE